MSRESVLVVGAWRNGISANTTSIVTQFEAKEKSGFRMLPEEEAILDLAQLLDGYDEFAEWQEDPLVIVTGEGCDTVAVKIINGFSVAAAQPTHEEVLRATEAIKGAAELAKPTKKAKANASS